jgi:hypothetical protein
MPRERWPGGAVASEAWPVGHCASDDNWAPHRSAAQCDRRLLRGWAESGHPCHERLGRWGACLVAQPASASLRDGRSGQGVPTSCCSRCRGRGTVAAVGPVARHRQAARRLCGATVIPDSDRDPGTAVRAILTRSRPHAVWRDQAEHGPHWDSPMGSKQRPRQRQRRQHRHRWKPELRLRCTGRPQVAR